MQTAANIQITTGIADAIGRKVIAEAVGVGETAVSNAVVRGKFPSSWYLAVTGLAKARAVECPPAVFGMKLPPEKNGAAPR